ncbi:MAG: hypothetical protein H7Y33_15345 [Cytophagales bacterium]|nr:hypothetical protein [Rhizobacter sp.]
MPSLSVYITGISQYPPTRPVENDAMKDYLGMVSENASRTRAIPLPLKIESADE